MLKKFIFVFFTLVSLGFAYDMSSYTDSYMYSVNESVFAADTVKINTTAISNVSVVFTVLNQSGSAVSTRTFVTNSTGQFNSTFSLTNAGNYTLRANVSGDVIDHSIKVMPYEETEMEINKPTYTAGGGGTLTVTLEDVNEAGVSNQTVTPTIRYENGTAITALSSCTTNSLGQCTVNFIAPSQDGKYVIEVNSFEESIPLVVGGYDAFMKVSPSIVGKQQNVTVRVVVKNANGNGITASTRQLVITAPNGTQTTVTAMAPANSSSGSALTGVYEEKLAFNSEGTYEVKVTIQPQGSNLTRELKGGFVVGSYLIDVILWPGSTTLFTPGQTVSLGIRLSNASSNEFMRTTQCGSSSCVSSLGSATIFDPSSVSTGYTPSVSEQASMGLYRMDISLPSTAKSGTYKVQISLNDSFGTGSGTGYFTVQLAKGSVRALDKFPSGTMQETFLPGNQIVLEFSAANASGAVNVIGLSSYSIYDESGNDKTTLFGTGATYNTSKYYVNITAPKNGGRYVARAKLTTALGNVDAEGWFYVDVLEIEIRPQAIGGGPGGGFTPFGGPGYMFAFRPNDTVQLAATVSTASEKRGFEGFMGAGMAKGGSAAGGHSGEIGGMFGIGGGTSVQGAQIIVDKIINLNTEEDITSSTTITNCITGNTGTCTLSLKSNVNGQNWTGGFHIVFVNVTTSDNQSDDGEGFFEVRRYFVNTNTRAAAAKNINGSGFTTFNDWFIGPTDNINITIKVIEPGTWQEIYLNGTATIQGVFYGGNMGEFIFPPKLQSGTNATVLINNSVASAVINAPSGGWKSGFYIVKVLVNISGVIDTGESFLMVKIYQGFGQPVNPTTRQMDFTTSSSENVSIQINVFDVKNNRPAANLTVTLNKILTFESFPPGELSYDKTQVSTGQTDANGQVIMALPVPSGGWGTGNFIASFDVTNGTVSDSIDGFFQVKNFFVEMSAAKWRFATNETISFNVTISSDPSWMRQMFGGGCPPGDPMCSGGGGDMGMGPGGPGGPGGPSLPSLMIFANYGNGYDIDNDGVNDINITLIPQPPVEGARPDNLTVAIGPGGPLNVSASISDYFWCDAGAPQCAPGAVANVTNRFDSFSCDDVPAANYSNVSTRTHNASGAAFFCVRASNGDTYKVQTQFGNNTGRQIEAIKHVAGSIGGITPINTTGTQGFSYFNATLKSIRVVKFDFETGETVMRQTVDYNVTSSTGSTVGEGRIVIPGSGSFKLKPVTTWSSGFYRVMAEFNTTPTSSDTGESGFSIETFFGNCYRSSWGSVGSGDNITITCQVTDPGTGGGYTQNVTVAVESVRNMFTFQNVESSASTWTSTTNTTNTSIPSSTTTIIILSQSLGNGQYEAAIKLNASASNVKRQSIWFEVKDFEPSFWSERWSYSSSDTVTLRAEGRQNNQPIGVNLSNATANGGSPEIAVYRYDKAAWSRNEVTNITVNITNQTTPFTTTFINLTKSGGWDEGSYEVTANITKMDAQGRPTGGKVEVRTWFDVRLFDVWGWSESWSNHPKNNVTLKVYVGSGGSYFNGMVNATVTAVTNTQTGATLTAGTHYNATNSSQNPSVSGDLQLNITPLGNGLPVGAYRATVNVRDESSGKSVINDIWFDVSAFQFWVWTERYDYGAGEDIIFMLNVYSPGGGSVNLTNARVARLSKCTSTSCTDLNVGPDSAVANATVFNANLSRLTVNTTANLTTGWYSADIIVNDTQNATASGGTGFQVKGFGVSGYIQSPSVTRSGYYINETMVMNATGTPGTNITNATFRYWVCDGGCSERMFIVNISHNLTAKNELVNITPTGLSGTWPTSEWGNMWYNIEVNAKKDSDTSTFWTYAQVNFPWVWNITGLGEVGPADNITANVTVYVDFDNQQRLANAVVNVSRVLSQATWADINSTPGAWNRTENTTNSNGFARVTIFPNSTFNWTVGGIGIEYIVRYGNATAKGYYMTTVSQKMLTIGKSLTNAAGDAIANATKGVPFNISVTLGNPESVDAVTNIRITNNALNASAQVRNITVDGFNLTGVSISSGASSTFSFGLNVTGASNVTSTILITPATGGFASTSTTLTFRVN